MPKQKPGQSKQDYATPEVFIHAIRARLGITEFVFDFAATDVGNAKGADFWNEADDSLSKSAEDWVYNLQGGWGWLNPPYSNIGSWAERCLKTAQAGGKVAFLVPASVGANWYRDFVHGKALVLALNGRLAFMADKPKWLYPKDCICCLYGVTPGFEVWEWRGEK